MSEISHTIPVADGLKLFVREWPAVGEPIGPPALCLHGLTRNSRDFEDVGPMIAAGGRRALALDVRGRGASSYDPEPSRYQPLTYAYDVLAVLDHLGLANAAFVGTSMGGLITMILAAIAPQRIERAVLNDVGTALDPRGLLRIAGYVGKVRAVRSWDEAADAAWAINAVAFPDAPPSFFYAMARKQYREEGGAFRADYDPAIATPFAQPGGAAPPDLSALWAAMGPIPTLLIRGGLSDLLAVETVADMAAKKPDLITAEVPRVGHAPMLTEPAAWAALSAFLGLRA